MLRDVSPFESSVGFYLQKASRAVTRFLDLAFQPVDLRFSQVVVLQMIAGDGSRNVADLAEWASMDPSTMSRTLHSLTQRGLVELADAERGPAKIPRLTDHGRCKLDQAFVLWEEVRCQLRAQVGQACWSRLRVELDHLAEVVESEREEWPAKKSSMTGGRHSPRPVSGTLPRSHCSPHKDAWTREQSIPDQRTCPGCLGRRLWRCPVCEGKQRPAGSSGISITDCRRCSGTGQVACETCNGIGRVPFRSAESAPAPDPLYQDAPSCTP